MTSKCGRDCKYKCPGLHQAQPELSIGPAQAVVQMAPVTQNQGFCKWWPAGLATHNINRQRICKIFLQDSMVSEPHVKMILQTSTFMVSKTTQSHSMEQQISIYTKGQIHTQRPETDVKSHADSCTSWRMWRQNDGQADSHRFQSFPNNHLTDKNTNLCVNDSKLTSLRSRTQRSQTAESCSSSGYSCWWICFISNTASWR